MQTVHFYTNNVSTLLMFWCHISRQAWHTKKISQSVILTVISLWSWQYGTVFLLNFVHIGCYLVNHLPNLIHLDNIQWCAYTSTKKVMLLSFCLSAGLLKNTADKLYTTAHITERRSHVTNLNRLHFRGNQAIIGPFLYMHVYGCV